MPVEIRNGVRVGIGLGTRVRVACKEFYMSGEVREACLSCICQSKLGLGPPKADPRGVAVRGFRDRSKFFEVARNATSNLTKVRVRNFPTGISTISKIFEVAFRLEMPVEIPTGKVTGISTHFRRASKCQLR